MHVRVNKMCVKVDRARYEVWHDPSDPSHPKVTTRYSTHLSILARLKVDCSSILTVYKTAAATPALSRFILNQ